MMYLETLLRTLKDTANVLVKLSSESTYGVEPDTITMTDSCGNHHTRNWLEAIENRNLKEEFVVKEVSIAFEHYMDEPQWTVILENEKSPKTDILGEESNRCAVNRTLFRFYE